MSSIHYLDNSCFHAEKKSLPFQRKQVSKYFPWKAFLFPVVSSVVGLSLIFFAFAPPTTILAGNGIASSKYPPQIADNVRAQDGRLALARDEIVSSQAVSTANPSIPTASLVRAVPAGDRQWPVRGRITTYYSSYHQGIDIATAYGTPIYPYRDGVVTDIIYQTWGFGRHVIVTHANGVSSLYAHMSTVNVSVGQTVSMGNPIGAIGTSGYSTGPHLHLEIYQNGASVNPLAVLP